MKASNQVSISLWRIQMSKSKKPTLNQNLHSIIQLNSLSVGNRRESRHLKMFQNIYLSRFIKWWLQRNQLRTKAACDSLMDSQREAKLLYFLDSLKIKMYLKAKISSKYSQWSTQNLRNWSVMSKFKTFKPKNKQLANSQSLKAFFHTANWSKLKTFQHL